MDSYQKAAVKIEQFCCRIGKLSGYGTDTVYCKEGGGSYFAGAGNGFSGGRGRGSRNNGMGYGMCGRCHDFCFYPVELAVEDCHG